MSIRELEDGTLVAYLDANGELTTASKAVQAILHHPDGGLTVAVKDSSTLAGREGPST